MGFPSMLVHSKVSMYVGMMRDLAGEVFFKNQSCRFRFRFRHFEEHNVRIDQQDRAQTGKHRVFA